MKQNKFIIICFFTILFGILILYPVNYVLARYNIISVISFSNKEPNLKPGKPLNNKIESIKTSITNKTTNFFPGYSIFNSIDKSVSKKTNKSLYNNILSKDYYPVGKNSDGEYIYTNGNHYVLQNSLSTEELNSRFKQQIDFFNSLDLEDVNIFIPYRFEYTPLNNIDNIRNMSSYINKFKNIVNPSIKISEFMVDNYNDYLKYFYKTDHHYNMMGAYESYKIIMNMLDEPYKYATINKEDISYYGSMARSSYSADIKDDFLTLKTDLGEYDVYVNGELNNLKYKPKKIVKNKSKFFDYYVSYYNGLFGNVCYDFHNPEKDNLLILEDSYGWQIDDLIASSFNKTYIVDIRHDEYKNGTFNLKKFVEKNEINKVLFLYEAGTIFFDQYDYGMKDKVIR